MILPVTQRMFFAVLFSLLFPGAADAAKTAAQYHSSAPQKYRIDLAPSADLAYAIKASEHGITLQGDGTVQWRAGKNDYSVDTETRAMIFGKIHSARSEGIVDEFGLAPLLFTEKRPRKQALTVAFDRKEKTISFSRSAQTYPIRGGEQDRTSATWQLVALVRGARGSIKPGISWTFFVAGRTDGEPWTFRVMKQETVRTPLGTVEAFHLSRLPLPEAPSRKLDIWLAPSLDWYPVRIRYSDEDIESIEQILQSVEKK